MHPDLPLQNKSCDNESSFVLMFFSLSLTTSYAKFPWHCAKTIILLIDRKSQIQALPHYFLEPTMRFPCAWKIHCIWRRLIPQFWCSLCFTGFFLTWETLSSHTLEDLSFSHNWNTLTAAPAGKEGAHPASKLTMRHTSPRYTRPSSRNEFVLEPLGNNQRKHQVQQRNVEFICTQLNAFSSSVQILNSQNPCILNSGILSSL